MNIQQAHSGLSSVNSTTAVKTQPRTEAKPSANQLSSAIGQTKGNSEVRTFMGEMKQAMKSGTFDAAKFADQAPKALKDIAAKEGINLEQEFKAMHKQQTQLAANDSTLPASVKNYQKNAANSQLAGASRLSVSA